MMAGMVQSRAHQEKQNPHRMVMTMDRVRQQSPVEATVTIAGVTVGCAPTTTTLVDYEKRWKKRKHYDCTSPQVLHVMLYTYVHQYKEDIIYLARKGSLFLSMQQLTPNSKCSQPYIFLSLDMLWQDYRPRFHTNLKRTGHQNILTQKQILPHAHTTGTSSHTNKTYDESDNNLVSRCALQIVFRVYFLVHVMIL